MCVCQCLCVPAGDHVKFALPMAWSTTVLNWGLIEYWDAYTNAGELQNALDGVKWPLDWLLKASPDPGTFYCQVGIGIAAAAAVVVDTLVG